jgi:hypothetical protein
MVRDMANIFPAAISGMNLATRRLQSAAVSIANGPGAGGDSLEQDAAELVVSRVSFAANARVAVTAAHMLDSLLDIKV